MVNPYRTNPPVVIEPTMPWWKRLRCRLGWHPWQKVPFMRVFDEDECDAVQIMLHDECMCCGRLRHPEAAQKVFMPPSDMMINMVRKRTAAHPDDYGYWSDGTDMLSPGERAIYNNMHNLSKPNISKQELMEALRAAHVAAHTKKG